ncbi:oxidoreductase [uncultured Flavobacterium sp.]|uniref:WD40/YVTN/BNR-like repeat-containing protein n=1 Tax=uncultured Flavobacterium sp. TaxID=165435 RepID=UPI0030EF53A3|tara:strand:- start:33324 stop:34370 length:1047 start_codon:yes stop_codon:yes gene_type:complete
MKYFQYIFILLIINACSSQKEINTNYSNVEIQSILEDKISIRAILTDENYLWYAGNEGNYGKVNLKTNEVSKFKIQSDTIVNEIRSIAQTKDFIFLLAVANPANVYKISKKDNSQQIVYSEINEKVFYDSMQFKDELNGIAMGDPTEDCLSVIITNDGGNIWEKSSCKRLPKVEEGEAAFAASNSNLIITNSKVFLVSGGKKSRVFVSDDFGKNWQVYETPIVQGEAMTGIFSADFYNDKIGFITGGNYEKPNDNSNNKAITFDGGKTWKLVANGQGFGYGSCVQFVPNSKGKSLVSVGANGIQYSSDFGNSWKQLNEDKELYTIRFLDHKTAYAAGRNKIIKLNFNE